MKIENIQAVVFDMDGTLVDTEPLYKRFWIQAMQEAGYRLTEEMALCMRSLGRTFAKRQLAAWFGEKADYDLIRARRRALMSEWIRTHGVTAKPGATELLHELKKRGYRLAVCTASPIERTRRYFQLAGIDIALFSDLISATQVSQGKPSPEVYLFACNQLGLSPSACLAVEDSPNGVLSAIGAGCPTVMVPDLTQPDEALLTRLTAVVNRLDEIASLL